MAVIAIYVNIMLPGANYLFLARPEDTSSILDILPSNYIVRIIIIAVAISILFFVAYIPWLVKDIKEKKLKLENNNSNTNEL